MYVFVNGMFDDVRYDVIST